VVNEVSLEKQTLHFSFYYLFANKKPEKKLAFPPESQ
jgi:hypothetical protein